MSPAVLSLLALGTFFTLAAAILRWSSSRFRLAIRRDDTYDFGDEPLEASPWMPYQRPPSESGLQLSDGVVGASCGVHNVESDGLDRRVPRESAGEASRESGARW